MLLFAYGTLKDPRRRTHIIGSAAAQVIGTGTITGTMYDGGDYPVLRRSASDNDVVAGLLIDVDDAAVPHLDAYEGLDSGLYTREQCTVRLPDGGTVEAWVYVYARPIAGLRRIAVWPPDRG